jgi:hypothetical protein
VRLHPPEPQTNPPAPRSADGPDTNSQPRYISRHAPITQPMKLQAARRGDGAPVHHQPCRSAVKPRSSPQPPGIGRLVRSDRTPTRRPPPSSSSDTVPGTLAAQAERSQTPKANLRRAVQQRPAHAPRLLRHHQHQRQIRSTPTVAFHSARERMRQPHPSPCRAFRPSILAMRSRTARQSRVGWRESLRTPGVRPW